MKVRELIKKLKAMPQDADVVIALKNDNSYRAYSEHQEYNFFTSNAYGGACINVPLTHGRYIAQRGKR